MKKAKKLSWDLGGRTSRSSGSMRRGRRCRSSRADAGLPARACVPPPRASRPRLRLPGNTGEKCILATKNACSLRNLLNSFCAISLAEVGPPRRGRRWRSSRADGLPARACVSASVCVHPRAPRPRLRLPGKIGSQFRSELGGDAHAGMI